MDPREILSAEELNNKLVAMADALHGMACGSESAALVGIRTRGAIMAERLQRIVNERYGWNLPLGILDITLYRDDLSQLAANPLVQKTHLDFDVTDREIYLIDDVLYTGRTVRSALAEILDFGRPRAIRLAVLVDRGGHELPIQADLSMMKLEVPDHEVVKVCLEESDGVDKVLLGARDRMADGK